MATFSLDDDFFFSDSANPLQRIERPQCKLCGKQLIVLAKYCTHCRVRLA